VQKLVYAAYVIAEPNVNEDATPRLYSSCDKLHKLVPLIEAPAERFIRKYELPSRQSGDGSMGVSKGRSKITQYMPK
jgi:hypothetical protein